MATLPEQPANALELDRQSLEARLLQAQKLLLMGQLSRRVAHDLNNILTVVLGRSEFLLQSTDLHDSHRREVEEIRQAGEMAMAVTHHLLDFGRPQEEDKRLINLSANLEGFDTVLRRIIGDNIKIHLNCAPNLSYIHIDQNQLEHIMLNLLINARDAMPEGGGLMIETAQVELSEADAQPYGLPSGSYVTLIINDTGCGMDEATKARIFEPFYTTKPPDKNIGLGLPSVLNALQQIGGAIDIKSVSDRGTTVTVYFPVKDLNSIAIKEAESPGSGERATILLVEESMSLRSLVSNTLIEHNYTVLTAQNGPEATHTGETNDGKINLAIIDFEIPAATETATRLQALYPSIKILYISNDSDGSDQQKLKKPFTEKDLVSRVDGILSN